MRNRNYYKAMIEAVKQEGAKNEKPIAKQKGDKNDKETYKWIFSQNI